MKVQEHIFAFVQVIEPEKHEDGEIIAFMPQSRYDSVKNLPLNSHGNGPFCQFKIQKTINEGGIYLIVYDEKVLYVGKCESLSERFGPRGYGAIHPRNCYRGGQSTNCRINNLIYSFAKKRQFPNLWFLSVFDKSKVGIIEQKLISELRPSWNIQFMQ